MRSARPATSTDSRSNGKRLTLPEEVAICYDRSRKRSIPSIATQVGVNKSTVSRTLRKVEEHRSLDNRTLQKGRYKRGSTVLTSEQQDYITQILRTGRAMSSRKAWKVISANKRFTKVSYNTVNKFVKSLGKWTIPKLEPSLSSKNKTVRYQYNRFLMSMNYKEALFVDESGFETNRNKVKVSKFNGRLPAL